MILPKFRKVLQKLIWSCLFMSPLALAEQGRLETIEIGDNPLIELPGPTKTAAQVRIALELHPYEKILTQKSGHSDKQIDYRVINPLKHVLRARLERTNHFYIGEWHIESVPVRWSREERILELNMRVYKRYGESKELEEYVGNLQVIGSLVGEEGLYSFSSNASRRFNSKHGHPIVDLLVVPGPTESVGNIARQPAVNRPTKN